MEKISFDCSIKQLESIIGLDSESKIVRVSQKDDIDVIRIDIMMENRISFKLRNDQHLSVDTITNIGDAIRNPQDYIELTKGQIRGGNTIE